MGAALDLAGHRFGSLVAIEPTGERRDGKIVWRCRCDCGNEALVTAKDLRSGNTKSCGCLKHQIKDLTGQRFGRLTVVGKTDKTYQNNTVWHCVCDCGNEIDVMGRSLTSGNTKSCGCLNHEPKKIPPDAMDNTRASSLNKTEYSTNTSGIRGVSWNKKRGKWEAYIKFKGRQYKLGLYDDILEAKEAREKAEALTFEEFLDFYTSLVLSRDRTAGRPAKDIRGMKFGKLTPLFPTGKRKNTSIVWRCQCDCGEMLDVKLNHLTSGHTTCCTKCGEIQRRENLRKYDAPRAITHPKSIKDYRGKRLGFIRVVSPSEKRLNRSVVWNCICDCGKHIKRDATTLKRYERKERRNAISCGCTKRRKDEFFRKCIECGKYYEVIPGMIGSICPDCGFY